MAGNLAHVKRLYQRVDVAIDEVKLHALEAFRATLNEPLVKKELEEHPDFELSRRLGFGSKKGVGLDKAFLKGTLDAGFAKRIVPSRKQGELDEALIVFANLRSGDKIQLTATTSIFELGVYDSMGNMKEAIRQDGPVLELLRGPRTGYT